MRGLCLRGADVVVQPANLVLPWCQQVMTARSIENRVFTVTANRVGVESARGTRLEFTGRSQVTSPSGELLLSAPSDAEHAAAFEIDPALARDKHINPLNDLFADRRTDLY
jgi:predicted amidohydrolase